MHHDTPGPAVPEPRFRYVQTNGLRLHVAEAGPPDGPLVLLLHGFPEFWYGWRHQLPALARAGYRVWAPDQRGYNLSDKPRGRGSYALDSLVEDALGLIDAAGSARACVAGHDWGGAVAWRLAERFPERVDRLAVLNCPHPRAMTRRLRRDVAQLARSWYMLAFQVPWLPEIAGRTGDWALVTRALLTSSRPGTFSRHDLDRYRAAWSRPGAFTAMLHWYRALWHSQSAARGAAGVAVPTLIVWGARDSFLRAVLAEDSLGYCADGRLEWIAEATHWVQHEEPARINALLTEFFGRPAAAGDPGPGPRA
jgi:epoxide hydrolase 4